MRLILASRAVLAALSATFALLVHRKVAFYMDVADPVYQNIVGNQLTAPVLFKVLMAYKV